MAAPACLVITLEAATLDLAVVVDELRIVMSAPSLVISMEEC